MAADTADPARLASPPTAAVVLAAGEGSRMGKVPKCLIRVNGEPLILRALTALQTVGVSRIVVVTGYHAERIEPMIPAGVATVVRNPAPERGQPSSVQTGLRAVGAEVAQILVMLADQPLIGAAELRHLLAAFAERPPGTRVMFPEVNGQRGNPVVLEGSLSAEVFAQPSSGGLRAYIDAHPEIVYRYPTEEMPFVLDLDTPDDMAALAAQQQWTMTMP